MSNQTQEYPYTCPDCGGKFNARFPIDPTRPFYCRPCHLKRRDKQKGDAAQRILEATSIIGEDRPRSGYHREPEALSNE